jgi:hypothetical protein
LTGIFPTELATTIPVESMSPSPVPAVGWKLMRTFWTGVPEASSACAVRRRESPA